MHTFDIDSTVTRDFSLIGDADELTSFIGGFFEATAAARSESEGATFRAEQSAGNCQDTWRNYPHVNIRPDDPTVYRQHRCGRELRHRGTCRCRYCDSSRSSA